MNPFTIFLVAVLEEVIVLPIDFQEIVNFLEIRIL